MTKACHSNPGSERRSSRWLQWGGAGLRGAEGVNYTKPKRSERCLSACMV